MDEVPSKYGIGGTKKASEKINLGVGLFYAYRIYTQQQYLQ